MGVSVKFDFKNLLFLLLFIILLVVIPSGILFAIVILSIVVLVHEFGHYIVAKANGIFVSEFALGMGPKIISIKPKETVFSLRALPIGGFCNMHEDINVEDLENDKEQEKCPEGKLMFDGQEIDADRAFGNKSVWARMSTILAGAFFNFILTFVAAFALVAITGYVTTEINGIIPDSPAEEVGLEEGDIITRINGKRVYIQDDLALYTFLSEGEELLIEYERNGERYTTNLTPMVDEGRYLIGINPKYEKGNVIDIAKNSYYQGRFYFVSTFESLKMMVKGEVTTDDVAGPVGMFEMMNTGYNASSEAAGRKGVLLTGLGMIILISTSLGVMNLLPFPALDGGRFVFLLYEAIRGKPANRNVEATIHFIGFAALMILMVFLLFNDISNLGRFTF